MIHEARVKEHEAEKEEKFLVIFEFITTVDNWSVLALRTFGEMCKMYHRIVFQEQRVGHLSINSYPHWNMMYVHVEVEGACIMCVLLSNGWTHSLYSVANGVDLRHSKHLVPFSKCSSFHVRVEVCLNFPKSTFNIPYNLDRLFTQSHVCNATNFSYGSSFIFKVYVLVKV